MVVTSQQLRTSVVIAVAGVALLTAAALHPIKRSIPCASDARDILSARLTSTEILGGEQDIAITIAMPDVATRIRPPLSLAIVIDRSGSMEGTPLANAKAAAARLVDELDERDAFTIVTYSSSDDTVVPITRATHEGKAAARAAIARIWDDGNTCISCGIARAADELVTTPLIGGLRRMVLISDGQANTGLYEPGALAALATETAARGISLSTVGVGLDFDEVTMARLADVGHGHYYFVEDTAQLAPLFARELAGLADTVAYDVRLVVDDASGVIEDAYGYPLLRQGDQVVIPIADLRAGETRKVVLRSTVAASHTGRITVAQLSLHWRRPSDGMFDSAHTRLDATIVRDPARVAATLDRTAVNIVEQARTARILEQATTVYDTQGVEAAQKLIERNLRDVKANALLDAPAVRAIEAASNGAIDNFAKAPAAKAKKAARADAYQLAR